MSRRWGGTGAALAAALVCARLLTAPPARADASPAGSYRAPAECPDHAAWEAALRASAGPALASLSDRLAVAIERRRGGVTPAYSGRIRQRDASSSDPGREVRGATCRGVFEALTLIARLGLARLARAPGASEPPSNDASSSERIEGPPAAPSSWTLTPRQELALAADPEPAASAPQPRSGLRVAGAALALWGGAARVSAEPDLGLALAARWQSGLVQPFVLLGVYAGGERFGVSGTTAGARLERVVLHAVACPLRLPRESPAGVRACLDLDAGVLRGSGVSVEAARGHTAPWLSTGVQLRADWSPWGPLELGVMVGGLVALSRPRFYFEPDTTAFRADAAALRAGASAGVSF